MPWPLAPRTARPGWNRRSRPSDLLVLSVYDKLSSKVEAYQEFLDRDNDQNDALDLQAHRRILLLRSELRQSPKKQRR